MHEDDGGASFLKHMAKAGNDQASLTNYANLIYARFAKVPVSKVKVAKFMADLLPHVSRCLDCDEPMGKGQDFRCACEGCVNMYANFCIATVEALERHRNTRFVCLEYEGLPYRKPWQRVGRELFYTLRKGA